MQENNHNQPQDIQLGDNSLDAETVKELTEEEKHEIYVQQLKDSKITFKSTRHNGNITVTKFGKKFHKKRNQKNRISKASRKANR